MPDHVFSTARLRGYRVLEDAGLGEAVELQVLNTVVAGRLWLPFSLIEIAFRNAADKAISEGHPSGSGWLVEGGIGGEALLAMDVAGRPYLQGTRDDGSTDDPVADAARMAARQLSRDTISRDDLIAHLMLGFWVHRCPEALARLEPPLEMWEAVAATLGAPLDDPAALQKLMNRLLRTRNRVAHHEPLLFRAKHVFTKAGAPKVGADLIASLQGAVDAFLRDVKLAVDTASAMAPMAAKYIDAVPDQVKVEIAWFEAKLASELMRLREAREARIAAQARERSERREAKGGEGAPASG